MTGMYLLLSVLCVALGSAVGDVILEGNYNVTSVCTTVKLGTALASTLSCSYYYSCTSSGPVKTNCPSTYQFDLNSQQCVSPGQSSCAFNRALSNPCSGNVGNNWVQGRHCNSWTYCQNTVAVGSGQCPSNERFDSGLQQCVFGKCATTDTAGPVSGSFLCSVVPPNMYFGSASNCSLWNYCSANQEYHYGSCPTNTVFIVSSGLCGPNSNGICNRVTSVAAETCTTKGQIIPDPKICGNYLICDGDSSSSVSCGYGQFFDTKQNACMDHQLATPVSTCNICQYATTSFVNAVNNGTCNTYYYCANGQMEPALSPNTCPTNYFFDADKQGCVPLNAINLQSYAQDHGACKGAKAPVNSATTVATNSVSDATTTTSTTTTIKPAT